jgi:hypothetical protein
MQGYKEDIKIPLFRDLDNLWVSHFLEYDKVQRMHSQQRFPAVILKIKDKNLKKIALNKNEEFYKRKICRCKKTCTCKEEFEIDTINNIIPNDLHWCDCNRYKKIAYERILGNKYNLQQNDSICWGNCVHTLFGAAKRQLKRTAEPDPKIAEEFVNFGIQWIEKCCGEELDNFGYSYTQWLNHLSKPKQDRMILTEKVLKGDTFGMDPTLVRKIQSEVYEAICKVEVQAEDGKPRMVCSIPDKVKFVMGPVCWALEEIFSKKLKGYCGNKNLSQMEDMINNYITLGFTKVVEGDGSAFDNSQDYLLKGIDRYVYNRIINKIHHVKKELFRDISQRPYKVMDINYIDHLRKKTKTIMTYAVLGTVFSGDADTTLMNTTRMALYNIFVNHKAGLVYDQDYVVYSKGDDFTVMYKPYIKNEMIEKLYYNYFLTKPKNEYELNDTRKYGIGQICKFLEIGGVDNIHFCSLRSWIKNDITGHIALTRDPKKLYTLAKYSRKIKTLKGPAYAQYLIDQAIALEVAYKGIDIFEVMAKIYRRAALQYITKYNPNDYAKEYKRIQEKAAKNTIETMQNLSKQTFKPFSLMNEDDPVYRDWFEIKEREEFHKIEGSYWETMKKIQNQRNQEFTSEELQNINKGIKDEFDIQYLEQVLA